MNEDEMLASKCWQIDWNEPAKEERQRERDRLLFFSLPIRLSKLHTKLYHRRYKYKYKHRISK